MTLPLVAQITLLVGAVVSLVMVLFALTRPYVRFVAAGCALLALLLLLFSPLVPSRMVVVSSWRPSALMGSGLSYHFSPLVWPLALAWSLVCAALLGQQMLSRTQPIPLAFGASLALMLAGLSALGAANLLTLLVTWAAFDVMWSTHMLLCGGAGWRAALGLATGSIATTLTWLAALVLQGAQISDQWHLMIAAPMPLRLMGMAAFIRLAVYPLHLGVPMEMNESPHPLAVLPLMTPIVAWGYWLRLSAVNAGTFPGAPWMLTLGALTVLVGGVMAWVQKRPRPGLIWAALASMGSTLLAAGLAGNQAIAAIGAGAVSWGLATLAVLQTRRELRAVWWEAIPALGTLGLIGMPPLLGFATTAFFTGGLPDWGGLGWFLALFLGQALQITALARVWLQPDVLPASEDDPPAEQAGGWTGRLKQIAYGAALVLPALPLLLGGLHPPLLLQEAGAPSLLDNLARPGWAGWLFWLGSLAAGAVLAWLDPRLRPRATQAMSAIADVLRLEWLYSLFLDTFERLWQAIRAAADLVEGTGAILWALSLSLLILLLVLNS